jgi:hypothetical protein
MEEDIQIFIKKSNDTDKNLENELKDLLIDDIDINKDKENYEDKDINCILKYN